MSAFGHLVQDRLNIRISLQQSGSHGLASFAQFRLCRLVGWILFGLLVGCAQFLAFSRCQVCEGRVSTMAAPALGSGRCPGVIRILCYGQG